MAKKHNNAGKALGDRRLGTLIDRLGPINNACRGTEGIDKLELVWDLGDALLRFDPEASDDLLWTIADRSYLTRDLLRYALIIRRGWQDRAVLRRTFPRLKSYSLFREALPFLKGDRCGIPDDTHEEIVGRLNDDNPQATKEFLLSLKTKKIGRKHKKGQAVAKMSDLADSVRSAVQQLLELPSSDPDQVIAAREALGAGALLTLAQLCMALAEDSAVPATKPGPWPEPFADLADKLLLASKARREDRAGFRKALGPLVLMEAADFLNAMRSEDRFQLWQHRRGMRLSLP